MAYEKHPATTLSVVIPTWRRPVQLRALLDSLHKQTRLPDEIIVACRCDDYDSLKMIDDWADSSPLSSRHKVVKVSEEGHLPPLIAALKICESDIFCQIDDDSIPREDWLLRIEKDFKSPLIGGIGGTIYDHRDIVWNFRPSHPNILFPSKLSWYGRSGKFGHAFTCGDGLHAADCFLGSNMAFRKEAIKDTIDMNLNGGSAISYETDIALSVKAKGFRLYFDPKAIVDHYPGPRSIVPKRGWNSGECFVYAHNLTYTCFKHLKWYGKLGFFIYFFLGGAWGCPGPMTFILSVISGRGASFGQQFVPSMKGRLAGLVSYYRMSSTRKKAGA
jgi:glycosyltransferase involved in cell wall biosynthesis